MQTAELDHLVCDDELAEVLLVVTDALDFGHGHCGCDCEREKECMIVMMWQCEYEETKRRSKGKRHKKRKRRRGDEKTNLSLFLFLPPFLGVVERTRMTKSWTWFEVDFVFRLASDRPQTQEGPEKEKEREGLPLCCRVVVVCCGRRCGKDETNEMGGNEAKIFCFVLLCVVDREKGGRKQGEECLRSVEGEGDFGQESL